MADRRQVAIAEFQVAREPVVLVSYGLGSCLGIALYDPRLRCGGLAHALLPAPPADSGGRRPGKDVEGAIRLMVAQLAALGAERRELVAKLAGGANMFAPLNPAAAEGIGARNIAAARQALGRYGIPLVAEDVGGSQGRTIEFDLTTGLLRVRSLRTGELTL